VGAKVNQVGLETPVAVKLTGVEATVEMVKDWGCGETPNVATNASPAGEI
jgi:hypothetical protein